MTITRFERTKKGRCSLFVDDEFQFTVHPEIFSGSHLKAGDSISTGELQALYAATQQRDAKDQALKLLANRSYSKKALQDKLIQKGYEGEIAQATAQRMEELGLIDDHAYAQRLAADLFRLKQFASDRVAQELLRRGVDRELADEIIAPYREDPGQDPRHCVLQYLTRRCKGDIADEKIRRKLVNALQRLGYSYEDIRGGISDYIQWLEEATD